MVSCQKLSCLRFSGVNEWLSPPLRSGVQCHCTNADACHGVGVVHVVVVVVVVVVVIYCN